MWALANGGGRGRTVVEEKKGNLYSGGDGLEEKGCGAWLLFRLRDGRMGDDIISGTGSGVL